MTLLKPMLFASYAREDLAAVRPILTAAQDQGVDIWSEVDALLPGQAWTQQIKQALDAASALLIFLSRTSVQSSWVKRELHLFIHNGRPVISVVLDDGADFPVELAPYQRILTHPSDPTDVQRVGRSIADIAMRVVPPVPPQQQDASARNRNRELAESLANETRKRAVESSVQTTPPRSVFVVHGHDDPFVTEVEGYLNELGLEAVVLRRIGGAAQSLFQKFMQWGKETRFALVLLTADDLGASRVQYQAEGVGDRSLQFRARQNVILELGFFYGHLGWESVFVLFKGADKIYPNFERPSDLDGVVFDHVDQSGRWRGYLREKLHQAGFPLPIGGA